MSRFKPTDQQKKLAKSLVEHFSKKQELVSGFSNSVLVHIRESPRLKKQIHTLKDRIKDPDHLLEKIYRKMADAKSKKEKFAITTENLFTRISDLAGIRLLHLHTSQIKEIDAGLKEIFDEQQLELVEGPFARTWDNEYSAFFRKNDITVEDSPTMYTSVHYVVESGSRTPVTCEIQVRTLMEEVWGEVDHAINYPHKIDSVPCYEQIRALARATSTATRIVDGIFNTLEDIKTRGEQ